VILIERSGCGLTCQWEEQVNKTELERTAANWRNYIIVVGAVSALVWLFVAAAGSRDVFTDEFNGLAFLVSLLLGGVAITTGVGFFILITTQVSGLAGVMSELERTRAEIHQLRAEAGMNAAVPPASRSVGTAAVPQRRTPAARIDRSRAPKVADFFPVEVGSDAHVWQASTDSDLTRVLESSGRLGTPHGVVIDWKGAAALEETGPIRMALMVVDREARAGNLVGFAVTRANGDVIRLIRAKASELDWAYGSVDDAIAMWSRTGKVRQCVECGAQVAADGKFCGSCGATLHV
jgi:hypothetical protein